MKGSNPALDLAELRRSWGDAYRITLEDGRFRATHIISGQAVDAGDATELRKLIINAEHDPTAPRPLNGGMVSQDNQP